MPKPVRAKTLYTLASAKENSVQIAGLGLETLYTLSLLEQKTLYTLSHLWATMVALQVLKKVAP